MRILHISTRLILGGSQENTVLSCEGQLLRGHEVHLAYGPIFGPEGSLLDRVRQSDERHEGERIVTHEVPHLVREVSTLADWRGYQEVRRLIREVQPDVVHTHSSKAGILGRAAAWAERGHPSRQGRPLGVVHTIHGPPFMPGGAGSASIARLVSGLKTGINNGVYTLAERFAAARCHVIVSVADAMTRTFLDRGIGRAEQYVTVYSGMETERFVRADAGEDRSAIRSRLGFAPGDFVIGSVARLAQHKGHDDVLDALTDDLLASAPWRLLWVGDGWWRERLERRLESLGLRDRAVLTGLVPPERVPGLMRAMDVLVHASTREGLPRTVPQAHLCGVMPIAYACDGAPEAIERLSDDELSGTGVLVEPGDLQGLRAAVKWASENPDARQAAAGRGRAIAAVRFSAEGMVEALEGVYERALGLAGR